MESFAVALRTIVTGPPAAATRIRPIPDAGPNRMKPSLLQVPPRWFGASARSMGAPPARSTRLSRPVAKKPNDFPSGDQNDPLALLVPGNTLAAGELSDRIHSI